MIRHNGHRRRLIAHSGRGLFWAWIRSALYYTLRAMAYCIKARWHRAPIPLSSQLTQLLIGQPQQVNTKKLKIQSKNIKTDTTKSICFCLALYHFSLFFKKVWAQLKGKLGEKNLSAQSFYLTLTKRSFNRQF